MIRRKSVDVLGYLKQAIGTCADVLKWAANIQGNARQSLVTDLQSICSNCEDAYGAVLARLVPVKSAFADPTALARKLRNFAADQTIRRQFKPDHLCGSIDQLLQRLQNNLDPLKYSIDFTNIRELRSRFELYGDYDFQLYKTYDEFTRELDQVANQISDPAFDPCERAQYAQRAIENLQSELRSTLETVRQAKADVVRIV
jgi:hypothetical protein